MIDANGSGSNGENRSREDRKQEAILFWSTKYRRSVSEAEVDEITRNLTAYFAILRYWDAERQGKER